MIKSPNKLIAFPVSQLDPAACADGQSLGHSALALARSRLAISEPLESKIYVFLGTA